MLNCNFKYSSLINFNLVEMILYVIYLVVTISNCLSRFRLFVSIWNLIFFRVIIQILKLSMILKMTWCKMMLSIFIRVMLIIGIDKEIVFIVLVAVIKIERKSILRVSFSEVFVEFNIEKSTFNKNRLNVIYNSFKFIY